MEWPRIDVGALRRDVQSAFVRTWTQRADVVRPGGQPVFDPDTGTYSDPTVPVASGMACSLQSESVPVRVDVAGDPQTQTRLELRHDPAVKLQVDDRVTFTVHDSLTGDTFHVVGVGEAYEHIYGLAFVQRTEPDSGS